MIRLSFSVLLLAALILSAPASAQSRRELAERIDGVEAELTRIEDRFLAGDPVAETLLQRMDALDFQVRELTGEIERLGFENRQMRAELERLGADLDMLLAPPPAQSADGFAGPGWPEGEGEAQGEELAEGVEPMIVDDGGRFGEERAAATGMLGGGQMPARTRNAADLFNTAQAQLLDGDFIGARQGFLSFLEVAPQDPLAGEAQYWLGETYFVEAAFGEAADAFVASLRASPDGLKAPDALVRLAASLAGLGDERAACDALSRFDSQFPNADESSRARAQREAARAGCS